MKKAIFASERTFRDGWEIGTPIVLGQLCELTETPYIKDDFIQQRLLNTITDTLKEYLPKGMMAEGVAKYGIRL